MDHYPTISKSDVTDSVLQLLFEGPIRQKIDEWTSQCIIEFLEWFKLKGGNTPFLGLYYLNEKQERVYCTTIELLDTFKKRTT